jgi:acetyl esterase/lipase
VLSCEIIHVDLSDATLSHKHKPVPPEYYRKKEISEIMRVLVTDYDNMLKNRDPLLFPGWMSKEEMQKLPGVILQTAEWDFFRFDVHTIIPKLQQAGVYLDHADYDVDGHGVQELP